MRGSVPATRDDQRIDDCQAHRLVVNHTRG
jgi:hypothetical protein